MTGIEAIGAKASVMDRLARFRHDYPGVVILAKAFRPVAYPGGRTVYGRDLAHLLDQLDEICPPADRGG